MSSLWSKLRSWFIGVTEPKPELVSIRLADLNMIPFVLPTPDGPMEGEVNADAASVRNRAAYPWFYTIAIEARELGANGLPMAREQQVLDQLFDRILADLSAAYPVVVIGRNTLAGNHEIWMYTDMMAGGVISDMKDAYPEEQGRLRQFNGAADPGWNKVEAYLAQASRLAAKG